MDASTNYTGADFWAEWSILIKKKSPLSMHRITDFLCSLGFANFLASFAADFSFDDFSAVLKALGTSAEQI